MGTSAVVRFNHCAGIFNLYGRIKFKTFISDMTAHVKGRQYYLIIPLN